MLVLFKGAGEMATGCAHRLVRSGFKVIMSELPQPLAVRRQVSFAQAVYDGSFWVEGVEARSTTDANEALKLSREGIVAVYTGPFEPGQFEEQVLVEATLTKENADTRIDQAAIVIGLGPGFTAGLDVHAVIETQRGHDLGRIYYTGSATANTSEPGAIMGYTHQRVLKAPHSGVFTSSLAIGGIVQSGHEFGRVDDTALTAAIPGVVRGLLWPGTLVAAGTKLGDIDPRGDVSYCSTISDKARTISGGVLEAILSFHGAAEG